MLFAPDPPNQWVSFSAVYPSYRYDTLSPRAIRWETRTASYALFRQVSIFKNNDVACLFPGNRLYSLGITCLLADCQKRLSRSIKPVAVTRRDLQSCDRDVIGRFGSRRSYCNQIRGVSKDFGILSGIFSIRNSSSTNIVGWDASNRQNN